MFNYREGQFTQFLDNLKRRASIKSEEAKAVLTNWFLGDEGNYEDLDILYSYEDAGLVIAIIHSRGSIYCMRLFSLNHSTKGTTWEMSQDECLPFQFIEDLKNVSD